MSTRSLKICLILSPLGLLGFCKSKPPVEDKKFVWQAPDTTTIPNTEQGALIRYGLEVVTHTSRYFGPEGSISKASGGMNCQNCHLDAGTRYWGNNYSATASTYPKFKDRRGAWESATQKVLDCFNRSLNGVAPDSNSREIKAIMAYINWLGKDVPRGTKPDGALIRDLPLLDHMADTAYGRQMFYLKCERCHGRNGQGQKADIGYTYPPLWGSHSYNRCASMHRLTRLAGFIKDNMPHGIASFAKPDVTDEEAWAIAGFICSQQRDEGSCKEDWPDLKTKFADISFGPWADTFSAGQHTYGPFGPIQDAMKKSKSQAPAKQ